MGMVGGEGMGGVLTGLIRDVFLEEVAFKLGSEDLKKGVCQTGWQVEEMLQAVKQGSHKGRSVGVCAFCWKGLEMHPKAFDPLLVEGSHGSEG